MFDSNELSSPLESTELSSPFVSTEHPLSANPSNVVRRSARFSAADKNI